MDHSGGASAGERPDTNIKPATALPWKLTGCRNPSIANARDCREYVDQRDDPYIVHAANAYPRLVAELRRLCIEIPRQIGAKPFSNALLAELGESQERVKPK